MGPKSEQHKAEMAARRERRADRSERSRRASDERTKTRALVNASVEEIDIVDLPEADQVRLAAAEAKRAARRERNVVLQNKPRV
jgi:hypothetical protein